MLDDNEEGEMLEESGEIIDGHEHQGQSVDEQQVRLEEDFQPSAPQLTILPSGIPQPLLFQTKRKQKSHEEKSEACIEMKEKDAAQTKIFSIEFVAENKLKLPPD